MLTSLSRSVQLFFWGSWEKSEYELHLPGRDACASLVSRFRCTSCRNEVCFHDAWFHLTLLQHINSTSINDHPKIDPNFLDSEWDNWILAKASAYGRKMFQTKAFQEIVVGEVYPGRKSLEIRVRISLSCSLLRLEASIQSDADWIQVSDETVLI